MCDFLLEDILGDPCPNPAGVEPTLKMTDVTQMTSIGAAVNHVVSTFTPATDGVVVSFTGQRIDADLKSTQNDDGTYTTNGVLFLPRQAATKAKFLNTLGKSEAMLVEWPMLNGERVLLGAMNHPCTVYCDAEVKPRNGYRLRLVWLEHANLPYHVTGAGMVSDT